MGQAPDNWLPQFVWLKIVGGLMKPQMSGGINQFLNGCWLWHQSWCIKPTLSFSSSFASSCNHQLRYCGKILLNFTVYRANPICPHINYSHFLGRMKYLEVQNKCVRGFNFIWVTSSISWSSEKENSFMISAHCIKHLSDRLMHNWSEMDDLEAFWRRKESFTRFTPT